MQTELSGERVPLPCVPVSKMNKRHWIQPKTKCRKYFALHMCNVLVWRAATGCFTEVPDGRNIYFLHFGSNPYASNTDYLEFLYGNDVGSSEKVLID